MISKLVNKILGCRRAKFKEIDMKDIEPGCLMMTSLKGEGTFIINLGMKLLGLVTPHACIYVGHGKVLHNTRKKNVNMIEKRHMRLFYDTIRVFKPVGVDLPEYVIENAIDEVQDCKFNTRKMYSHWFDMLFGTPFASLFTGDSCVTVAAKFYRSCGLKVPSYLNPVIIESMIEK